MMKNPERLRPLRPAGWLWGLLAGAGACLPGDQVMGAPAGRTPVDEVPGIHVRRSGDYPDTRDSAKMLIDAARKNCEFRLKSPFKLNGNPDRIGETVIDEYFAPTLGRSTKVVKTMMLRQVGGCESTVEQQEKRTIRHYRPDDYTRYERETDKNAGRHWRQFEHEYLPGLAGMLGNAFDAAEGNRKITVSPPLGHKTYLPGRVCEVRKIDTDTGVEFSSCIHATGLRFPSHISFASEVVGKGKTVKLETVESYADRLALSRDLFFPTPGEKVLTEKDIRSDPNNPMNRWCAAEKARTGVDPCKDGDE